MVARSCVSAIIHIAATGPAPVVPAIVGIAPAVPATVTIVPWVVPAGITIIPRIIPTGIVVVPGIVPAIVVVPRRVVTGIAPAPWTIVTIEPRIIETVPTAHATGVGIVVVAQGTTNVGSVDICCVGQHTIAGTESHHVVAQRVTSDLLIHATDAITVVVIHAAFASAVVGRCLVCGWRCLAWREVKIIVLCQRCQWHSTGECQ